METTSFSSCYGVTCGLPPLPPVRAVANSLSFSNLQFFSSRKVHSLTSAPSRCRTASASSSSSAGLRICCGVIREINETEFSEVVLKSNRPVLVEFVATWCGPCRLIAPAIKSIAQEYEDKLTIVKIDHDSNPQLIQEYKVYGLPALILFKNGKEVPESRREGAITKAKLKEYIDGLLQSVSIA